MSETDDVIALNRLAWDEQSRQAASPWVQPVDTDTINRAKQGDWQVILTPTIPVPAHWFGDLSGKTVLALASGGGQQAPLMAAAGAQVVSFDNSDVQLEKDMEVARREKLSLTCERGDMADLGRFAPATFDLIFHPVSNVFAPQVREVWRECFRVLRPGGRLLSGFMNPCFYLFDHAAIEAGAPMTVKFGLPYRDPDHLSLEEQQQRVAGGEGIEFSHSLDDQIGGQLDAGFILSGFYEDRWDDAATPLNAFMPTSMATLAIKPAT